MIDVRTVASEEVAVLF